jgi:hypothetical protein
VSITRARLPKKSTAHRAAVLQMRFDIADPKEVNRFLRRHPDVLNALNDVPDIARQAYPDYKTITVRVVRDEVEEAFLSAVIRLEGTDLEPHWPAYENIIVPRTAAWDEKVNYHFNVGVGLC